MTLATNASLPNQGQRGITQGFHSSTKKVVGQKKESTSYSVCDFFPAQPQKTGKKMSQEQLAINHLK